MENKNKPIEELLNEGWKDTLQSFAGFRIYKKDNERMLYDSKEQRIYDIFSLKEEK